MKKRRAAGRPVMGGAVPETVMPIRTVPRRTGRSGWGVAWMFAVAMGVLAFASVKPGGGLFAQEPMRPQAAPLTRFEFEQVRFAAPVRLIVYAPSEVVANKVSGEVFDRLKHLDRVMSDYDPDSELSRLCATAGSGKPVEVSEELFAVIKESQRLAEATGGAFDISIAPVVKLWRGARRKKQLPTPEQQAAAMALVDYRSIRLDEVARTVELLKPGMRLDLGGIAQGYAADDALRILKGGGIASALVDVSGDIRVGDAPPDREGWRIEVESLKPKAGEVRGVEPRFVTLTNCAISTAGDAYQFTEIEGVRYSHIVDARTGGPMRDSCSVTVIAKDALTADGLDTAVCVLDDAAGKKLVQEVSGVRAFVTRVTAGGIVSMEFASKDATEEFAPGR